MPRSTLKGSTTLLAHCLRVGDTIKTELRLPQAGQFLNVDMPEAIAKALGRHFPEIVVLKGQATWDLETWQILDFKVTGIADFTAADPYQAMQDLAAAAQGHWEGVDALEYVRELRGADEDEPSSRAQSAP